MLESCSLFFSPGAFLASFFHTNVNCMKLEVECHSGFKAEERPVRFRLDERQYLVEEIVDQWYAKCFLQSSRDDGSLYILRREDIDSRGRVAFGVISSNAA